MASKLLISVSLFATALLGNAQTADFYFHNGSKHYVFGEKEKAKTTINTGLQKFPQDPQLNSLAGLIKEEEKQQSSSGEENKDQEKNQDQKSESQQQEDSTQQDKPSDKEEQEQQQKDSESEKDKENKGEARNDGEQKPENEQDVPPIDMPHMTPEQARQFLDAQKQEDKALIFQPEKKQTQSNRQVKDW